MEKDGHTGRLRTNPDSALNAYFSRLEDVLRPTLWAFFGQVGLEKSADVRAMLGLAHAKWDDTSRGMVHLEGLPVVAANFKFVKTVLNYYHHSRTRPFF
jgi:hypothetical protein